MAASELFQSYESDYTQLASTIRQKLDKDAKEQRGEQRKATLRRVEMEVEEADEIIDQMDIEARQTTDKNVKQRLQVKLRSYKNDLERWRNEAKKLASTADREALLAGSSQHRAISPSNESDASDQGASQAGLSQAQAQRARLLNGTDKLTDGQRRLDESHRIALETESLGTNILGNLRTQREQIENTRDTLYTADNSIDKASNTLKKMVRTMYQQRFVTIAIIIVLVFLIAIVLYSKFS
ncbi:uncharacterized protein L969DRAFT_75768 [Mixia osmundae IAM 14324]|uniref:t-SNARE coiled-coil homology domain-containing protein n=1 Tax=Mixia osmundae (strain CBS 9802 / IAM 14324 / JCM 22182 / KY 12970) TaxID=764103 RepID=G7E758_MIXOS|nr:uncharacterized protein L969DRAFT_75768 [Mixia osmundae IAM 14324]KEI38946.1 hypothetical protein L969DRAFT_75768 [Mixia osmundae IAM 14324]GAA98668.1 hypothetical protein E5Q_05356 [Mixia osmundae IAM 14324]